jgi:hypothetical protein
LTDLEIQIRKHLPGIMAALTEALDGDIPRRQEHIQAFDGIQALKASAEIAEHRRIDQAVQDLTE